MALPPTRTRPGAITSEEEQSRLTLYREQGDHVLNTTAHGATGANVGTTNTQTLTNKTVNLASNTLTGTTAQFNSALSDNDFATQAGTETLTNKTIALGSNTVSGTTAQFNTALTDNDFCTLSGTETVSNKTLDASNKYGGATDYSSFEADGTLVFTGAAKVWNDVYPSSVTVGVGADAPSFSVYNGNLRCYEFVGAGVTKALHLGFQIPHDYYEGSTIIPHLHLYIPDDAGGGVIKFYCEYTWTNIGQTGAVATTTVSGTVTRAAAAGISNNHILSFGDIVGTGMTISNIFMCRVYRNPADAADTFGSSVWLKSADIHYEMDTAGSRSALVK